MGPSKPILTRDFNKFSTSKFLMSLSFEQWQDVFEVKEVNIMFNNFLNTYLKCFHSCFPLRKKTLSKLTQGPWITKGIQYPAEGNVNSTSYAKFAMINNLTITTNNTVLY